jgi:hypothetical protein
MCTVLLVLCMVINGLVRRHALNRNAGTNAMRCTPNAKSFVYTLAHLLVWLTFIELGLRVWGCR